MSDRAPGFAMAGALLALLLAALFATVMADLARTELRVATNGRRLAVGLAAIDECAAVVARDVPLGWAFTGSLAGPDGVLGTLDDGALESPAGCRAIATPLAGPGPRLLLDLEVERGGARRIARAILGRATLPGPAALLWLAAGDRAGPVTGRVGFDGIHPGASPAASAAAPGDPAILDAWIAAGGIDIAPGTGAPLWAPAPPLADVVAAARAIGAVPVTAALAMAAAGPRLVSIAEGDLMVDAPRWARGVVVVTGHLTVDGGATLTVEGLLIATDGVRVVAGSTLAVRGAIWAGGGAPIGTLEVAGDLQLAASPGALVWAANALTLPHEARILGWLDR